MMVAVFASLLLQTAATLPPPLDHARQAYQEGAVQRAIDEAGGWVTSHPTDPTGYADLGIYVRQMGVITGSSAQLARAVRLFAKALELHTTRSDSAIDHGNIGSTYIELGEFASAQRHLDEAYRLSDRLYYKVRAAYSMARAGLFTSAIARVQPITVSQLAGADSPGNEGLTAVNISLIYALAKQPANAVSWLRIAESQSPGRYVKWARNDRDFALIHNSTELRAFLSSPQ